MPYNLRCILLSVLTICSHISCSRLNNSYDKISMTCDTREENLRSFHFIKITSDNNNNASQWQGILVNPNGQSINLKNSANGCIMVPKVASDQATRLFIRDKLSSNYQEINPQVLESNTLSFVDVTKSVQQKNSSSVQLN